MSAVVMKDFKKKREIIPETAEHIQALGKPNYAIEFPIDLNLDSTIPISLPEDIEWKNFDSLPTSMKISNTGKTVILSTHWTRKDRPTINGGPLLGGYVFSELHFHWGRKDFRGGKHTYNRKAFPLEMHALFYKPEYGSRAEALRHKNGAIVLVFACKVEKTPDPAIDKVCKNLTALSESCSSVKVEPFKIVDLIHNFTRDYFLYWGSLNTESCHHLLLWFICREPFHISQSQVHLFRALINSKQNHIRNNSQSTARIHPSFKRVFHVNPSRYTEDVLYDENFTSRKKSSEEIEPLACGDSIKNNVNRRHTKNGLGESFCNSSFYKPESVENQQAEKIMKPRSCSTNCSPHTHLSNKIVTCRDSLEIIRQNFSSRTNDKVQNENETGNTNNEPSEYQTRKGTAGFEDNRRLQQGLDAQETVQSSIKAHRAQPTISMKQKQISTLSKNRSISEPPRWKY